MPRILRSQGCMQLTIIVPVLLLLATVQLSQDLSFDMLERITFASSTSQPKITAMGTNDSVVVSTRIDYNDGSTATPAVEVINIQEQTPTIFYCQDDGNGIGEARKIFQSVLPEYKWRKVSFQTGYHYRRFKREVIQEKINHHYDFLLKSMQGGCPSPLVGTWVEDEFKGNILYISGESMADYMPQRMEHKFVFASVPETDRSLTLTYLQMVWYAVFRPLYSVRGEYYNEESNNGKNSTTPSLLPPPETMLIDPSLRPRGNAKKDFLIYAASNCVNFREKAFEDISKLRPVHFGGKCKGTGKDFSNRTKAKNNISLRNWWNNVEFYGNYEFCLVMEHVKEEPYITEKILMAFLGGCVPMYYGSEVVLDIFHPDAFVYYDVENPQPALDKIASLSKDPKLYQEMQSKPILRDGHATIARYFSFRDDLGGGVLKERIRQKLGMAQYHFVNGTIDAHDGDAGDSAAVRRLRQLLSHYNFGF